jgi:hypothetical protein
MSYYDNEEKPKRKNIADEYQHRDFERSYPTYKNKNDYEKERGGCLSAFLVVQFIYTGFIILAACMLLGGGSGSSQYYYGSRGDTGMIGMILFGMAAVRMGLVAGVWNWNKLAYQLLLGLYGFAIVASFCIGNVMTGVLSLVEVGIFYALVQDKLNDFE